MTEEPKKLVWFRLPFSAYTAFVQEAARARMGQSETVERLLACCGAGAALVLDLEDSPEVLSHKLGVWLPLGSLARVGAVCNQKQLPVSVYIRKLIYHFLVKKTVWYVKKEGHYTLAYRHDQS